MCASWYYQSLKNRPTILRCRVREREGGDSPLSLWLANVISIFYWFSGILAAPYNFSVAMSNTTFVFSWGAPYSLDVTDCSPDIFYYTLCTNITIYGCRNISSDPDCTFPRTCTTSLDFNGLLINGSQNTTIIVHGGPIVFTLYAVNGAGNGNVTTASYFGTERGLYVYTESCM